MLRCTLIPVDRMSRDPELARLLHIGGRPSVVEHEFGALAIWDFFLPRTVNLSEV